MVCSSCGTMNLNNTAKGGMIGGGGGALLGATIGGLAGHGKGAAIGAAIGTAVGAGTGVLIGKKMDKAAEEARQVEGAKVEQITDTVSGLQTVKVTFESGILFVTGKSDLNNSAKASLSKLVNKVLIPNNGMDVIIKGYTDNQGWRNCTAEESAQKNMELSQMRAQSVSSYLLECGVPATQLKEVRGMGESNPVADNATPEGQDQNRRVEVYLYASHEMIEQAAKEANEQLAS